MRATPTQNMIRIEELETRMATLEMMLSGLLAATADQFIVIHRGFGTYDVAGPPNGDVVNANPMDKDAAWKLAIEMNTLAATMRSEAHQPDHIPDTHDPDDIDEDTPPDHPVAAVEGADLDEDQPSS
jgi:hypothetical protein